MDPDSDQNRPQLETPARPRFAALVEPPIALALAFGASIFLSILGFFATAVVVENDPVASLLGVERKLDVLLTPQEGRTPTLDPTRAEISGAFEGADVVLVPEGGGAWRVLGWIEGDPSQEQLTALTAKLDELGWSDPVPVLKAQPRYFGTMENPRRMRVYVPPAMTVQAFAFILCAWIMVRWRKPGPLGRRVRPIEALVWGLGAAVVAFLASTLVGGGLHLAGWEVEEQPWIQALMADRPSLILMLPWLVVVGPVSEEVFFRGYVFRRLFSSAGAAAAYTVSAVLFAVIHWHPIGFPMYAIIGLVFCWVYRRTGNLWAPVCGHVIYNAIVVGIPLLAPAAG